MTRDVEHPEWRGDRPEEEPVDLSPLAPLPARWDLALERTLRRVDATLAGRREREDPLDLIASWRRPLMAAALAAAIVLATAEVLLERREARAERIRRLVAISAAWPTPDRPPTAADFLRALDPARNGEAETP